MKISAAFGWQLSNILCIVLIAGSIIVIPFVQPNTRFRPRCPRELLHSTHARVVDVQPAVIVGSSVHCFDLEWEVPNFPLQVYRMDRGPHTRLQWHCPDANRSPPASYRMMVAVVKDVVAFALSVAQLSLPPHFAVEKTQRRHNHHKLHNTDCFYQMHQLHLRPHQLR